ncbi:MAG: M48 family peptidase, partial [Nitrospirota bacterium]
MTQSSHGTMSRFFNQPIGRRAMLALGAQGAMSLYTAIGAGAALSLFGSLTGCYRAPGTARDQVIFFSEEKELQFGL